MYAALYMPAGLKGRPEWEGSEKWTGMDEKGTCPWSLVQTAERGCLFCVNSMKFSFVWQRTRRVVGWQPRREGSRPCPTA